MKFFVKYRKILLSLIGICMILFVFGIACTRENQNKKVLAKINDFELTLEDFERQLTADVEMTPDFKLTQEAKDHFLNQLIRKEIMIQEAMKRKLDRREAFIRAIERYWQSTLIRDLLELKGDEISKQIYVSEEEIDVRYDQIKKGNDKAPPKDEIRGKILSELKEEKRTRKLKEWIEDLQKGATITIDRELLQVDKG